MSTTTTARSALDGGTCLCKSGVPPVPSRSEFKLAQAFLLDYIIRKHAAEQGTRPESGLSLHEASLDELALEWERSERLSIGNLTQSEIKVLRTEIMVNPASVQGFLAERGPEFPTILREMVLGWTRGVEGLFVVVDHDVDTGAAMLIDETGASYTVMGIRSAMLGAVERAGYHRKDILCVRACLLPHPSGVRGESFTTFDGRIDICSPVVDPCAKGIVAKIRSSLSADVEPPKAVPDVGGGEGEGRRPRGSSFDAVEERWGSWGEPGLHVELRGGGSTRAWLCLKDEVDHVETEKLRGLLMKSFLDGCTECTLTGVRGRPRGWGEEQQLAF